MLQWLGSDSFGRRMGIDTNDLVDRIAGFLRSVGIAVIERELADGTFLPGVLIEAGTLVVDRSRLRWPGDLLHEAGHLAVMPATLRSSLSDALDGEISAPHAGEVEATAWAYAACVALGIDASLLFHGGGYHGHSQGLVMTYTLGVYPGSAGLASAGLTRIGDEARKEGVAPYPHMIRWLRD